MMYAYTVCAVRNPKSSSELEVGKDGAKMHQINADAYFAVEPTIILASCDQDAKFLLIRKLKDGDANPKALGELTLTVKYL